MGMGVRAGDKHTYAIVQEGTNRANLCLNEAPGPSMGSVSVEAPSEDG